MTPAIIFIRLVLIVASIILGLNNLRELRAAESSVARAAWAACLVLNASVLVINSLLLLSGRGP